MATRRSQGVRRCIKGLLVAVICGAVMALPKAGAPPNLLDDNRSDLGLEAIETAAFNTAIDLLGMPLNPLTFLYPPVVISGRVLSHPEIHNIYVDDDWDAHNPDAPTRAQIDAFTQNLVSSGYLESASQYGIGSASFTGSHGRSLLCSPLQPEFDHAEFVELLEWVSCEVGFSPPIPGVIPPLTGVPQTNDNTLYVIYLPRSMSIVDGDCGTLSGYHFFSAAPNFRFDTILGVPVPVFYSQTFAYAVVPSRCAQGSDPKTIRDHITAAASHEILEAATDPLVGTGWINNTVVTGGSFFSDLINSFSNISTDLKVGEVADICEQSASPQTGPPAFQHPTPPLDLSIADASLDNSISVAPYWSNSDNDCAPFVPKSTLTIGTPHFGAFVTSSTPLTIDATIGGVNHTVASVSYRVYPQGTAPPAFTSQAPPVQFSVSGADGPYTVDFFATGDNGISEFQKTATVIVDNTPPVVTITVPAATQYAHSDVLTLDYSASDGAGSGVASTTASMDGSTTLNGHGLADGQAVNLLLDLTLGPHSFTVQAQDHVTNQGLSSVTFTIIVTPDSIKQDVNIFRAAGKIKNDGLAASLLSKLDAAAAARARGDCATAANIYSAFIAELQAQSGQGVDASAAAIMIGDAQYLIANCP